jgi:outer membrane protein TolC
LTAETDLFNAETDAATVRYNILFDQYRLLAASGQLLDEFSVELQVLDD